MPPPTHAAPAPEWLIYAIIGGFLVVFPLLWCFVVWLLSQIGGWKHLARRYAAGNRRVTGERCSGIQGMVGSVSYRFILTLHFNAGGFFIEVMPLFKIGHPRLFIPWSAVSARNPCRVFWWKAERLSIGQPVIATITLPAGLLARHQARG
jgi:hypothetical protein